MRIVAILVLVLPTTLLAQSYPNRTIRFVGRLPLSSGGGNDIAARLMAPKLAEALGQPVIVENRTGAGTNIAQETVARSAPDGHTLLLGSPPVVINKHIYKNLTFDPERDLTGVSMFAAAPNVLAVNAASPMKTVKDLIATGSE